MPTGDPTPKTSAIVNHAIQSLGFKTNFTLVDQSVMYGKYCGVPKAEIDACPNVGWIRDWADPQTLLDPTFAGYNIVPTNNSNWGQVNDPQINAAMRAAEKTVGDAGARAQAWANVDKLLVVEGGRRPVGVRHPAQHRDPRMSAGSMTCGTSATGTTTTRPSSKDTRIASGLRSRERGPAPRHRAATP